MAEARTPERASAGSAATFGSHTALLYETDEERGAALAAFFRPGIEAGDGLLLVVDGPADERAVEPLRRAGIDTASLLADRRLEVRPASGAYLRGGVFDPDRMCALLRDEVARALAAGRRGLRIAGEMSWVLGDPPGAGRIVEYECRAGEVLASLPAAGLCLYDRRRFPPALLLAILAVHPHVAVDGAVHRNPGVARPDVPDLRDGPRIALQGALAGLSRRTDVEELLRSEAAAAQRDSEALFRTLVEAIEDGVGIVQGGAIRYANPACERLTGYSGEDLLRVPMWDLTPDIRPAEGTAGIARMVEARASRPPVDLRVRCRDGTDKTVEASASIVPFSGQPPVLCVLRDVTERRRQTEEIRASRERARALAVDLQLTEERERRRLADELHEGLGQYLALAQIRLGSARERVTDREAAKAIDGARETLALAIDFTRTLTSALHPPLLDKVGLTAAVESFADRLRDRHGLATTVESRCRTDDLDEHVLTLLYAAVRELLVNVVKHAEARSARVSFDRSPDAIRVAVEDDGLGLFAVLGSHSAKQDGHGLASLCERIDLAGGALLVEHLADVGTRVVVTLPLARGGASGIP